MNYYSDNIDCLKNRYKIIYEKFYETDCIDIDDSKKEFSSLTAINGEEVLLITDNGKSYRMNSSYNPSHEAKIWAGQYKLNNLSHLVAMYGFGNGCFVRALAERLKEEDRLYIYEPSRELFEFVLQNFDITDLLKNEKILIAIEGINEFDFHFALQYSLNIKNMYSLIRCMHPYYDEIFENSCVTFWKEIRDLMFHTQININTEVNFGPRLLENSINNLKYLKDSYILHDIAPRLNTELPAIVVAAGPSVHDNIQALKNAKGKAYIFAVDRVLDYLLDEGVEPDFVVTVDPKKPLKYFSHRENITIPLIAELSSNWEILDAHKGDKIFFSCGYFYRLMYEAAGKVHPLILSGASVATVAFSVCLNAGFHNIILVGQDLAYDGNVTHAGGVAEDPANTCDFMVEGIDGNQIRSRHDWKEFLKWFEDMIYMNPEIVVIDTKKKGAKIHGAIMMPLEEAVIKYTPAADKDIQFYSLKDRCFSEESFAIACKFLEDSLDDIYKIKKKTKEAIELCEKQIRIYKLNASDNNDSIKNYKKISKINKFIETSSIYGLIDMLITSMNADELSEIYMVSEEAQNDKIETYQKSKKMYLSIIDIVDYIQPKLNNAVKMLLEGGENNERFSNRK